MTIKIFAMILKIYVNVTPRARRAGCAPRAPRSRGRAAARTQLLVNHVLTDMVIMSKSQIFRKYNSSARPVLNEHFMAGLTNTSTCCNITPLTIFIQSPYRNCRLHHELLHEQRWGGGQYCCEYISICNRKQNLLCDDT